MERIFKFIFAVIPIILMGLMVIILILQDDLKRYNNESKKVKREKNFQRMKQEYHEHQKAFKKFERQFNEIDKEIKKLRKKMGF